MSVEFRRVCPENAGFLAMDGVAGAVQGGHVNRDRMYFEFTIGEKP